MGLIQDYLRSRKERKERYKDMEDESRFSEQIQERKLSAEERELNRFVEEERQVRVKELLNKYRKKRHNEIWHGGTALDTPNMFKNHPSIMTKTLPLADKKQVLKFK